MLPPVIKITKVTVEENYQILVEFDTSEKGVLDMKPYLDFGVFSKLRDPDMFNTARVVFGTVAWASGADLDPEFVYDKCVKVGCPETQNVVERRLT